MQQHIILDFDGVVADTWEDSWELVQHLHPNVTEEQYRIHHHLGNVYEEPALPFTPDTSGQFDQLYRARICETHVAHCHASLVQLAMRYRLHIVSSNSGETIERVLRDAGLSQYFSHVLGWEAHKSKAEKFRFIAQAEQFSLADSHYVTDTLGDLKEAAKVGLPAIAVTFGFHPHDLLLSGNPKAIVHSWDELRSFFLP